MSNVDFKPGDVVELKSGGPLMTVRGPSYSSDGLICEWFEGTKKQQGDFIPAALKRSDTLGGLAVGEI